MGAAFLVGELGWGEASPQRLKANTGGRKQFESVFHSLYQLARIADKQNIRQEFTMVLTRMVFKQALENHDHQVQKHSACTERIQ